MPSYFSGDGNRIPVPLLPLLFRPISWGVYIAGGRIGSSFTLHILDRIDDRGICPLTNFDDDGGGALCRLFLGMDNLLLVSVSPCL